MIKRLRINHQINTPRVIVIDEAGEQLGEMDTFKAIDLAKQKELDLVEVSPLANPPVCKIMDYGKYRYWEEKKEHKHRVSQRKGELKTIRLSIRISDHDLQVKAHQAKKFLSKGNKVQGEVFLRGREKMHSDLGEEMLHKFWDLLKEDAEMEKGLTHKGVLLSIIMKPKI